MSFDPEHSVELPDLIRQSIFIKIKTCEPLILFVKAKLHDHLHLSAVCDDQHIYPS